MLEETHIWSPGRQRRWEKTRTKGMMLYIIKMAGAALGVCLVIVGIYAAITWGHDRELPWASILGIPFSGMLSGLIVAIATWNSCEESYKRMRNGLL